MESLIINFLLILIVIVLITISLALLIKWIVSTLYTVTEITNQLLSNCTLCCKVCSFQALNSV